jgi:hypothetical protein
MLACGFRPTAVSGDDPTADAAIAGDGKHPDGSLPGDGQQPVVPALVQQATNYAPNSNAPLSVTLAPAPIAGHLLVMVGAAEHGALSSVTGGATWTKAVNSLSNSNIEIWFGVATGSGSTVTITFPAYSLPMWMTVTEWSDMATSNVLDATHASANSSSPASSGAIVTTTARDLVIFGVADGAPNTFGAPSQGTWSALTGVSSNVIVQSEWYQVVSATGTYNPQVTETHHDWDAAIAALRIAP